MLFLDIKMEIHHKIAGVIIINRKLLMVRKYNEPNFIMPGGRIKEKESNPKRKGSISSFMMYLSKILSIRE